MARKLLIPADSKHDIIQPFLEFKRCEEEICMLKEEMDCFLRYYNDKISIRPHKLNSLFLIPARINYYLGSRDLTVWFDNVCFLN